MSFLTLAWRARLVDWAVVGLVYAVLLIVDTVVPPFQRVFVPPIPDPDQSINYPLSDETVPTYLLVILSFVVPLLIIVGYSLFFERKNNRDLHPALLGLILAYGLTGLITDIVKVTAGRLRPDFYARCEWNGTSCTGDPSVIAEGRKSFPSGHSSFSWAGLGYLSLYLAAKLRLFDRRGRVWKIVLVLCPLIGAYLIAISRVDDYRHHPGDILAGAILGYFVAYFVYRQYYPSINAETGDRPYLDYYDQSEPKEAERLYAPEDSSGRIV